MKGYLDALKEDERFQDALKACMNCGICTAVCPAAEFYDYDPRKICDTVQRGNEEDIKNLLRGDTIWYCGQCLSCKPRCPRGNTPGMVITILRKVSQDMGMNKNSEMGTQQREIAAGIGQNILDLGYCVHPDIMDPKKHPEQGPVWDWFIENIEELAPKMGANYHGDGPGALHAVPQESLDEIRKIFDVTGGTEFRSKILDE